MKQRVEDLAVFGGEPSFQSPLHVGRPNIGNRDRLLARFNDLLDRRWLTNGGPFVEEFETRVARLLGVNHCISMCNGTVALQIAIHAMGMTGEVILPSFTFIATAHALQWQDITPVFCDISARTHTIDPDCVERLITPKTSGIIGVHLWGRPCAIDALEEIAQRRHLKLLYDASHAFGCSAGSRMIGNFGQAEVFSFHGTKLLNTFEGGAVVTNDADLAARVRLMKNFGFAGYDKVICLGINGKMSEPCAAMGLTGIESLDDFIATNRSNYHRYLLRLDSIPGLRLLPLDEKGHANYQYVVTEVDEPVACISRDNLIQVLHGENVIARRYFYPGCHRMEPYRSSFPEVSRTLLETERIADSVLVLPTGTAITGEDIDKVCGIVRFSMEHGRELTKELGKISPPSGGAR